MDELFKAIPRVLAATGNAPEVAEAAAAAAWKRVAGPALCWNAVPFRLHQKTLVIAVPDEGWKKQLEQMSGHLLFRINSLLGQAIVTFIEFRIDPKTVNADRIQSKLRNRQFQIDESEALKTAKDLRRSADKITDEHLRKRFLIAAGSCLHRRDSSE